MSNKLIFSIFLIFLNASTLLVAQTMNLKTDFGAIGNGVSDDSKAWDAAIKYFNKQKKGKLIVPAGNYLIGVQQKSGKDFVALYHNTLENVTNLSIEGSIDPHGRQLSKIKYINGLRFGNFNGYTASLGFALRMVGCSNITIKNLELDGNLPGLVKQGDHTTSQIHIGIGTNYSCSNIKIQNVYAHHFGMDGFYIITGYAPGFKIFIDNSLAEYNGRQGLSFVEGTGLKVTKSIFRYTAKGGMYLAPGANVDIENEAGGGRWLENILFEDCDLIDNGGGSGSLNIAGAVRGLVFKNCRIITENNLAIQGNFTPSRDFTFMNCEIKGAIDFDIGSGLKDNDNIITKFIKCKFTDNKKEHQAYAGRALINVRDNILFQDCSFEVWNKRSILASYKNGNSDKKKGTVVLESPIFVNVDTKVKLKNVNDRILNKDRVKIK